MRSRGRCQLRQIALCGEDVPAGGSQEMPGKPMATGRAGVKANGVAARMDHM